MSRQVNTRCSAGRHRCRWTSKIEGMVCSAECQRLNTLSNELPTSRLHPGTIEYTAPERRLASLYIPGGGDGQDDAFMNVLLVDVNFGQEGGEMS